MTRKYKVCSFIRRTSHGLLAKTKLLVREDKQTVIIEQYIYCDEQEKDSLAKTDGLTAIRTRNGKTLMKRCVCLSASSFIEIAKLVLSVEVECSITSVGDLPREPKLVLKNFLIK